MKTINVYLDTKDSDYGTALSKSLLQYSKFFSIQIGNPRQAQFEWDIYLTDDMNSSEQKTVFLTEEPALATINEENSCYIVHKYQHVGHFANILRLAHSDYSKSEMLLDETENSNIISICSSSGGTGCTSVALGICQELTRFHGKKILYISLEEFESTANYFPDSCSETNNVTKYVYSMLNKDYCCSCSPLGYLVKDDYGICAFHSARGRNPLRELNENEFIKFINHITSEKLFTDLIVDCGNGLDLSVVSALQLSSHIIHVSGKTDEIYRKASYLRTVASRLATKDSTGIIDVINLYVSNEVEEGGPLTETKEELTIVPDPSSFEVINGRNVISLDKMFGQGIRELVQHATLSRE